jgi:Ankyrin repeats (3 copies)
VEMDPLRIRMDVKLYEVASEGNIELLDDLLGAEVPNDPEGGQIAIIMADGHRPHEPNRGSFLSGVTSTGDTALHIAARFEQIEAAQRICQERTSLLTKTNDKLETPLHYAAQAGNLHLVRHFIGPALHGSNIDLIELLRKRNKTGETALYHAIRHQQNEVVEELMHADPHLASVPDNNNVSPLYLATMMRSLPIVTSLCQLLPLNVSLGAYSGPDGQTALHHAALYKTQGNRPLVNTT